MNVTVFIILVIILLFIMSIYLYSKIKLYLKTNLSFLISSLVCFLFIDVFILSRIFRSIGFYSLLFNKISMFVYILLGFIVVISSFFLFIDIFILMIHIAKQRFKNAKSFNSQIDESRRKFIYAGASVLGFACSAIGYYKARHPNVININIPIKNLHQDLKKISIVQISDIHIAAERNKEFVENIVSIVNNLNADIIVITGDIGDNFSHELLNETEPLRSLKSTYGSFYVTGNHEYYWDAIGWIHRMQELGIVHLENKNQVLQIGKANILLAGVTDLSSKGFFANQISDPYKAIYSTYFGQLDLKILLAHQPRSIFTAADAGFDLQLSGHTHGGQFWPGTWLIYLFQPFVSGLHKYKNTQIYVNKGTGYWGPPTRIGSEAEITYIKFKSI